MAKGYPDYRYFSFPVSVNEGGTGATSFTLNGVLVGNATSAFLVTAAGAAYEALRVPAAGGTPAFGALDLSQAAAFTGLLPVARGGTGEAAPSLVAGSGISITGTWPDQTITNTSPASALGDPVTVAHGGTGTAAPSLVAGANITITGTWPNNTIALTSPITSPFTVGDGTATSIIQINGAAGTERTLYLQTGATRRWSVYANSTAEGGANSGSNFAINRYSDAGAGIATAFFIRRSDGQVAINNTNPGKQLDVTGDVRASLQLISTVATGTAPLAVTSTTEVANLRAATATDLAAGSILAVAKGGTGTATPALVAGNGIQITGTWPANTIANTWGATTVSNAAADGALLLGSGAGTAAWGTPDGARVYNSASQSLPTGAFTGLTFDSERYDNGGLHSTTTNTGRLTAQKAGKYAIYGCIKFDPAASGTVGAALWWSGGAMIAVQIFPALTSDSLYVAVSTVYHLAAGEYVALLGWNDTGAALNSIVQANAAPEFAMQWVGP